MRVLLINTSETIGGAAIAAHRLAAALNRHGVKVCLLVRDKQSTEVTTRVCPASGCCAWPSFGNAS